MHSVVVEVVREFASEHAIECHVYIDGGVTLVDEGVAGEGLRLGLRSVPAYDLEALPSRDGPFEFGKGTFDALPLLRHHDSTTPPCRKIVLGE